MSRSGYVDDVEDPLEFGRWRGRVLSAIRGRRGQKFLRDLRDALEAMPEKFLIAEKLVDEEGDHCALGVLGERRGIDLQQLDPDEADQVAAAFDIAECLAREVVYENDEIWWNDMTGERRWEHMHRWVTKHIREENPAKDERN